MEVGEMIEIEFTTSSNNWDDAFAGQLDATSPCRGMPFLATPLVCCRSFATQMRWRWFPLIWHLGISRKWVFTMAVGSSTGAFHLSWCGCPRGDTVVLIARVPDCWKVGSCNPANVDVQKDHKSSLPASLAKCMYMPYVYHHPNEHQPLANRGYRSLED